MEENDPLASEPSSPAPNEIDSESVSSPASESTNGEPAEIPKTPSNSFRRELALATVQHANRSIAILLIALVVASVVYLARKELTCWLSNAESVKAGSFEVRLRAGVRANQLGSEFSKLVELNDQQLQLFLILGKQRGSTAAGPYGIAYTGEEITGPNLAKLKDIGLLATVTQKGSNNYDWDVSDKGVRLHKLLLEHIITSIKEAAVCQCEAAACKCQ